MLHKLDHILIFALIAVASAGHAQRINTRVELNGILIGGGTLDDFERYRIAQGSADNLNVVTLDSNTIANGQGPNLVNPGATYVDPSQRQLQWNGDNYFDLRSKTILANGEGGRILIDFNVATQAFGIDLTNFSGFGYDATVSIFKDSTRIGLVDVRLGGGAGESQFVGWRNDGGISRVLIESANYSWSPIIDNHQYGVVPEPASALALGAGLAFVLRRRRRRQSSR